MDWHVFFREWLGNHSWWVLACRQDTCSLFGWVSACTLYTSSGNRQWPSFAQHLHSRCNTIDTLLLLSLSSLSLETLSILLLLPSFHSFWANGHQPTPTNQPSLLVSSVMFCGWILKEERKCQCPFEWCGWWEKGDHKVNVDGWEQQIHEWLLWRWVPIAPLVPFLSTTSNHILSVLFCLVPPFPPFLLFLPTLPSTPPCYVSTTHSIVFSSQLSHPPFGTFSILVG